jgi:hypothetical protein
MTDPERPAKELSDAPPFKAPGSATVDDFERIDMRVGRIIRAWIRLPAPQ